MQWLRRLIGREQRVQHTPVRRVEWEQVVRRADLPEAAKLIALLMATYGNPDGSRVRPGDALLADLCDWSEKHVREQIKILRSFGLLECVRRATRGNAAVYQLTFPGEETAPVGMRVDPAGVRLTARLRGRGGRKPRLTGTPVPVNAADDRNPSSADSAFDRNSGSPHEGSDRNWSSGQEGPMTGTPVPDTERLPELEFPMTGTPVPFDRNSSSGHQYRPNQDHSLVGSDLTPTREVDQERSGDKIESEPEADTDARRAATYRAARDALAEAPLADRDGDLSQAAAELAAEGRVDPITKTIRAAVILGEINRLSYQRTSEG